MSFEAVEAALEIALNEAAAPEEWRKRRREIRFQKHKDEEINEINI